jgi:hypothetical protein
MTWNSSAGAISPARSQRRLEVRFTITSVLVVAIGLVACGTQPEARSWAGESPGSISTSSPASTPSAPAELPTSAATASPSPSQAAEPRLAILSSAVNGLRLRAGPSLAADVVEFLTGNPVLRTIDAGQVVAALDGPVASDGFDWYLVQVVRGRPLLGWAATPQDGDAWLVPSELECPAAQPDLAATMAMGPAATLYCSDGEDLTLEGYVVTGFGCNVMGNFEPMWLAHPCANMSFISPAPLGTIDRPAFLHYPVPGITNPTLTFSDDQIVRIVGHYDDAAAAGCVIEPAEPAEALDPGSPLYGAASDPAADVAVCRLRFVVTEVMVLP